MHITCSFFVSSIVYEIQFLRVDSIFKESEYSLVSSVLLIFNWFKIAFLLLKRDILLIKYIYIYTHKVLIKETLIKN